MSKAAIIQELEKSQLTSITKDFSVGDTIRVHIRIIEGEKERTQIFTGTVIARKGSGLSETFSVHRVAYGEGMERVFLLHSPKISKIEVVQEGSVRRSKLYYLRGTSGKKSKVKASHGRRKGVQTFTEPEAVEAAEVSEESVGTES
jgi:large subunit ribosomal protein L19